MALHMDRRQLRTKRLLHEALLSLIEESGMDNVTVSELAKKAEINRGTFYLHYTGIADMLEQTKWEVVEGLASIIRKLNLQKLMDYASKDEAYPVLVEVITYFQQNSGYFRVILGPKGDPSIMSEIKHMMLRNMRDKLNFYQPKEEKLLVPREIIMAYVASANLGVIQHWIETGCELSPEQLALAISRIVKYGPLTSTGIKPRLE